MWEDTDIFKDQIEVDDPLWKEYVDKAGSFDERMVDEWNKIVDVILVYVGIPCSLLCWLLIIELSVGCANHFRPDLLCH